MDEPMKNSHFRFMTFGYVFRDLFRPRRKILDELEIKDGAYILDFGCGPGSYSVIAAEMAGATGKVYALDIHSLAIQRIQSTVAKKKLANIETILSDCDTGLEDNSMDIVLLFDIFHHLNNPNAVLKELHRVLKPEGILSFSDHHMKEPEITAGITDNGLFKLIRKGERSYIFGKESS